MESITVSPAVVLLGTLIVLLAVGFVGSPLFVWTAVIAACLFLLHAGPVAWGIFAAIAVIFNVPPIRQMTASAVVYWAMKTLDFMPKISETERVALTAGDVWIERELFSGKPNFKRILDQPYPSLTAEEKAFIDGPVEKVCSMVTDWEVWRRKDLPEEIWDFMKKEKFLGMIIPKEYGGLGFSAMAHSEVIHKLASRSIPMAVTAMVPNSLGPAELLNHYGTDAQKKHWLPRLARGEEMPCFALTEPNAGSDAASIQATGELFKGDDGKLYMKLNWNKRWITLAAISTVLGLAFRLKDPKKLLGKGEDLGITCALIPSNTPGVVHNRRHDPMGVPFYNCPTQGKDVIVPVDAIIGGIEQAGNGWKMLMESLGAGRGISLPAQCTGGLKYITHITTAYATVRKQFGMSVGRFEGVSEKIAEIAGFTYICEAARRYTCGALDQHIAPPVVTAVMKYFTTELSRKAVLNGMDVLGGAGITRGPHNLLAHYYISLPVQITVEGANILTRTLMIFGQGALRAHPYAFKEVEALEKNDLKGFDRVFWAHIGHVVRNKIRWIGLSCTRGLLCIPARGGLTAKYYRKLSWTSATFAFMADLEMVSLGGALKAKGKITGRMADVLGWMYLVAATLKRFEAEGRRKEDEIFLKWSMEYAFNEIQHAFDGVFGSMEMPVPGLAWIFRGPIRWLHALNPIGRPVPDSLDLKLGEQIQRPSEQRNRFAEGIYIPKDPSEQMARLDRAFELTVASEDAAHKVKKAVRKGKLKKKPAKELYADAVQAGIITQKEFESVAQAEDLRWQTIQVDDFGLQEYFHGDKAEESGTHGWGSSSYTPSGPNGSSNGGSQGSQGSTKSPAVAAPRN